MESPSKERIQKYVDSLKSGVRELEACLHDGGTDEQLSSTSKTVVLCTALIDEAISRYFHHKSVSCEAKGLDDTDHRSLSEDSPMAEGS